MHIGPCKFLRARNPCARILAVFNAACAALVVFLAVIGNAAPVMAQVITFTPTSLPAGTVGTSYSQIVAATDNDGDDTSTDDGDDIFSYAVTAGSLPPGVGITPSGVITGTPTTGGSYTFTVTATDASSNTGTQDYTVNIGTNSLTINPAGLPNGTQGTAYNQTVSASGGTGPYTYSVSAGALPAGLSLNPSTGAIAGIPTGSGASSFTIQANDSVGNIGTRAYSMNIGTVSLTVNPSTLPPGTVGIAYSQTVSASGGSGSLHLFRFVGLVAGRLVAQFEYRRHHRHADRDRAIHLHHPGGGLRRQQRQPFLFGQHR